MVTDFKKIQQHSSTNVSTFYKKVGRILLSFLLVLAYTNHQQAIAQNPLEVMITIMEPYPVELEYYSSNQGNVFITITNVTAIEQRVYYHVRLIGNNGLDAQTKTFIKPMEPVTIAPFQTIVYTGDAIERDFPFRYPDDIQLTSATIEQLEYLEFQRALPEGTYVLCVTARDFLTDIPLTFDCSNEFSVYYADAPRIIQPFDEEVVPSNDFSNVSIMWEPPFSVIPPGEPFLYDLKMIDITDDQFGDLEILFENPGFLELNLLDYPNLFYEYGEFDDLALVPGRKYALQVRAKDLSNSFPLANDGRSPVSTFWYGFNPDDIWEEEILDEENPCIQNCYFSMEGINTTAVGSVAGFQSLEIGNFTIRNLELTNTSGQSVSGSGTIAIPWLNDVAVKVEFQNLSVNNAGRVFSGVVNAMVDEVYDPYNTNRSIAEEMNGFLRNGRVVGALAGGEAMGMPLGLLQNVMGYNLMVGFTQMEFRPNRASCQLMYNMHIPAFGEDGWISMAGTDICLTSGGFAQEFMLHPVHAYSIPYMDDISFRIMGHSSDDPDEIRQGSTFLEVDCNGIRGFGIQVEVDFPRSILVPDQNDGSLGEGLVTGSFFFSVDRTRDEDNDVYAQAGIQELPEEAGIHFLARLDIDPFQIAGIEGWGFSVENAWLDCSDIANPPNINWPENYDDPNLAFNNQSGRMEMQNTWKGIYIRRAELKSPDNFLGINGRKGVSVNHLIIDPKVSATIAVTNYINRSESNLDNWSLSLDSLFLTIVQNNLQNGGFSGELGMPITDRGQYFRYTALIDLGNQGGSDQGSGLNYTFSVSPSSDIHFPFMMAQATLSRNSYVLGRFTPGNSSQTYFETYLQGGVGISSDLFEPEEGENLPLYLPVVDFSFNFHSKDGFTNSHLGFANCDNCSSHGGGPPMDYDFSYGLEFREESFVGFPLNIEEVKFTNPRPDRPIFTITPRVAIATGTGGIAGSVGIDFISGMKNINGEQKLAFEKLGVSKLYIQQNAVYGLTLEGEIEFYNTKNAEDVGEKGARGMLQVLLPALPGLRIAAEFGTVVTNPNAPVGTRRNFGYWYLDGMVYFGDALGVPIAPPALALYGLGGGVFINMSRTAYDDPDAVLANVNNQNLSSNKESDYYPTQRTGLKPSPSFGSYGMKFAATLGTMPAALINMDVSLYGEISVGQGGSSTSLSMIEIAGACYFLSPISARGQTPIWATAALKWENASKGHIFDGSIALHMNVFNVLKGTGRNRKVIDANFHVEAWSGGKWWFHAGHPGINGNPNFPRDMGGLEIDLKLAKVGVEGYFMVGHNLPTTLPLPKVIENLISNENSGEGGGLSSATIKGSRARSGVSDNEMGSGVAFGFHAGVEVDITAWLIYVTLRAEMGFDVNLTQNNSGATCYIPGTGNVVPGINGWYGQGQVYAGLSGAVGLRIKFLGKKHDLALFEMGAAMMISGGGFNPSWGEGRAGVYYRVLGGAVKGSASFAVRIGDECDLNREDDTTLPVIYELWPEDGDEDVSIFSSDNLLATFYVPVGKIINIPVWNRITKKEQDKRIEIVISRMSLKNEQTGVVWRDEEMREFGPENRSVFLKTGRAMQPLTEHTFRIDLVAYEYIAGQPIPLYDGVDPWRETRTHTFTTGETPYPIPDDQIVKTIPIRRQRNFMRDEVNPVNLNFSNIIDFSMTMSDAGYFPDDDLRHDYEYYLKWRSMDGSDIKITTIADVKGKPDVSYITSNIPELEPGTIYACQLIRKVTFVNTWIDENGVLHREPDALANLNLGIRPRELAGNRILSETVNLRNIAGQQVSASDTISAEIPLDPARQSAANEEIIYAFYFRTSKYPTINEKLAVAEIYYTINSNNVADYPVLEIRTDENFDEFDIIGEFNPQNPGQMMSPPRVMLEKIFNSQPAFVDNSGYYTQAPFQGSSDRGGGLAGILGGGGSGIVSGENSYNQYLNHSLIAFAHLYSAMHAQNPYNIPLVNCLNDQNVNITASFPVRLWHLYNYNYSLESVTINFSNDASGYRLGVSDEEIAQAWERFLAGTQTLTVAGLNHSLFIDYKIPYRITEDALLIVDFANRQLERRHDFIESTGSSGGELAGGEEQIGIDNIPQTWDPTDPYTGGQGGFNPGRTFDLPIVRSCSVPLFEGLINSQFPAYLVQLDNMSAIDQFSMSNHRGNYSITFTANSTFDMNVSGRGTNRRKVFNYNYLSGLANSMGNEADDDPLIIVNGGSFQQAGGSGQGAFPGGGGGGKQGVQITIN